MRTLTWSAVPAVTVLAATGLVLAPTAAGAAPPVEDVTEGRYVVCEGSSSAGQVRLAVGEDSQGVGGNLTVTDADGNTLLTGDQTDGVVVPEGEDWSGSLVLRDPDGQRVGEASFAVDVVAGESTTRTNRFQQGNVRVVTTVMSQVLGGTATVGLPGETVALTGCTGEHSVIHDRYTQPDAVVGGVDMINVACGVPLEEGGFAYVGAEGGEHTVVSVSVDAGESSLGGETQEGVVTPAEVAASVPVFGPEGPLGDAEVRMTMDATGSVRFVQQSSTSREVFRIEGLRATGTLTLPDGRSIALECDGESMSTHKLVTTPNGPTATGPAPANDTVDGARHLGTAGRDTAQTRAAAYDAEVPLWCYEGEPEDPAMAGGHTVWYRFTGTGKPMTVDTGGSSFNTMLAVYRVDDGAPTEVACEDDHVREGWQAYATVDTVAGAEYLVQVGGFGHQSGLVKIALG